MTDSAELARINSETVSRKSLEEITDPVKTHLTDFRSFLKIQLKLMFGC